MIGGRGRTMRRLFGPALLCLALPLHVWAVADVVRRIDAPLRMTYPSGPMRLFNDAVHRDGPGADFYALYHAAREYRVNGDIYSWRPGGDGVTPPFYRYRYLPGFVAAVGPLPLRLEPKWAYVAWIAIIEIFLLIDVWIVLRLLAHDRARWPAAATWFVFTPLWAELFMGQFTFVTGSLILWSVVALRAGAPLRAALWWAAAAGLKVFPLVLLPMWWRARAFSAAVVAALLIVVLPNGWYFYEQPYAWHTFLHLNFSDAAFAGLGTGNFGLIELIRELLWEPLRLPDDHWEAFARGFSRTALGAAAAAVALARRSCPGSAAALLIAAHLLSYSNTWEHHYTLLLPLGTLVLVEARGRARAAALVGMVAAALPSPFVLLDDANPLTWDCCRELPWWQRASLPLSKVLPAGLIAFAAAVTLLRNGFVLPADIAAGARLRSAALTALFARRA